MQNQIMLINQSFSNIYFYTIPILSTLKTKGLLLQSFGLFIFYLKSECLSV